MLPKRADDVEMIYHTGLLLKRPQKYFNKFNLGGLVRERFFILSNKSLSYFEPAPGSQPKKLKGSIPLRNILHCQSVTNDSQFLFEVTLVVELMACSVH